MIISKPHRLLFVHVWKTGGTSIATALREGLELPREGLLGQAALRIRSYARRRLGMPVLGKHAYAADIRNSLGSEYEDYYSFGFVRNPWAWLVSWYNFVTRTVESPDTGRKWRHHLYPVVGDMSFDEFVSWVTEQNGLSRAFSRRHSSFADRSPLLQRDWLTDLDGRLIVDFVGRYESLEEDFRRVALAIDQPHLRLPHVNRGARAHYQEYYSPASRDAVGEYFYQDVTAFGYAFE